MFDIGDPDKLTGRVNLRVTPAEHLRLREDAELAGLSVSELVRRRYFGKPIIANVDELAIRELRRLGGLLKHLHNQSAGSINIAGTMADLQAVIKALAK